MVDSHDSQVVSGDIFIVGEFAWQVCLVVSSRACLAVNVFVDHPCLVDTTEVVWLFKGGKVAV